MKHKHHIIPRHMGGTDDPTNLVELTVEEHALAHKKLYEEHGCWQDYVAWQGLAKLDKNFDAAKQAMIEGGKKGAAKSILRWKDPELREKYKRQISEKMKGRWSGNNKVWNGKTYEVVHPDGKIQKIEGLRQWCVDNNLNPNTVANACLRGTKTHGGYFIRKLNLN